MTEHEIDLRTVGAVLIQGRQYSVSPGSLRLVRPVFTMTNDEGAGEVTCYGGHMHPPTMVFTTRDGMPVSGSYDHSVLFLHEKPTPEPVESVSESRFPENTTWRMRRPNTGGAGEIVTILKRERDEETGSLLISFDRGRDMPKDYRYETWPSAKFTEWYERYEPPANPRIYVKNLRGKQGHIVGAPRTGNIKQLEAQVQWHAVGARPVWVHMDLLRLIPATEVEFCPNGQTGDECGSGENQCEPCLAAENAEAEGIERSMNA